jgi:hypothetical protein
MDIFPCVEDMHVGLSADGCVTQLPSRRRPRCTARRPASSSTRRTTRSGAATPQRPCIRGYTHTSTPLRPHVMALPCVCITPPPTMHLSLPLTHARRQHGSASPCICVCLRVCVQADEQPVFKGGGELREYQWEAVRWMVLNWSINKGSILADEASGAPRGPNSPTPIHSYDLCMTLIMPKHTPPHHGGASSPQPSTPASAVTLFHAPTH